MGAFHYRMEVFAAEHYSTAVASAERVAVVEFDYDVETSFPAADVAATYCYTLVEQYFASYQAETVDN